MGTLTGTTIGSRILVLDGAEGRLYRALAADGAAADAQIDLEFTADGVLDRLRLREYDLLVIGAKMTALAGIFLLRDVRAAQDRQLAVLVVADPDQSVMLLDAMVDDCIVRPVEPCVLVERVLALADRGHAVRGVSRV